MVFVTRTRAITKSESTSATLKRAERCVSSSFERLRRSHEMQAVSDDRRSVSVEAVARSFETLAAAGGQSLPHPPGPAAADLPSIVDDAPSTLDLTDYDRAHRSTYLRLLDAAADGTPWEEVARALLAVEPNRDAERARQRYDSHFARAHWIASQGFWDLLNDGSPLAT